MSGPVPRTGQRWHRRRKHRSRAQRDSQFGFMGERCCDGDKRGAIRAAERAFARRIA